MNFGIIGYGVIGDVHAEVIENIEGAKLVAIATHTEAKAREAAEKHHCDYYTDYHEMLRREDIDIVSICLPSGRHGEAAIAAAEAGKHCIVEKPIEISADRAERMIDAFEQRGLKLSVIFQHRFDRSTQLIREAIEKDSLGKLNYGSAKVLWFRDEAYYQNQGWRGTWAGDGGGALMNQAIHSIDLLQYFMGPVDAICGKCDTLYHQTMETEDLGVALLRFQSGAIGVIEGTTLAYPGLYTEISVFGQEGSAIIKNDALHFYHMAKGKEPQFEELMENGDEYLYYGCYNLMPYIRQYKDVMEAIKQNREPLVSGREGLKSVKIVTSIYESSKRNEWIKV